MQSRNLKGPQPKLNIASPPVDVQRWLESHNMPTKPFNLIAVHDCFRCLPNYGNDLRKQYNLQLHLLAKSNMLDFLLSQLVDRVVHYPKLYPKMADEILNTDYALS